MDQDLHQHVQAEPIEKSYSLEKEATKLKAKIDTDEVACGASDNGEMEQFELIKDVSTKEAIVSDGNDTDSSFGEIDSENEVKKYIFLNHTYYDIRWNQLVF